MKKLYVVLLIAAAVFGGPGAFAEPKKPTVVLVHGAFADASSWNKVVGILERDGYPVIAAANPLRGVKADAAYISDILAGIKAPIVLVGHSYGGSVISEAAIGHPNVKALVFVSAFAPQAGETAVGLSGKFPGSTLARTLAPPVALSGGGTDLYIRQDEFPEQFAADVPATEARVMAAVQRPITKAALGEPETEPAWKTLPSWFIYGDADKNIPPPLFAFMAKRARSKETIVLKGASHLVMVSNPRRVANLIEKAAASESRQPAG